MRLNSGRTGWMRAAVRRMSCCLLVAAGTVLVCGEPALAQSQISAMPANASELLQIFQSLSPEQQDAILKQFGGGGGASGILGALGGGNASRGERAGGQRQTGTDQESDAAAEETEAEPPGLNGEDWVIVQADYPPVKPAAPAAAPAAPAVLAPGAGGANQNSLASLLAATATAPPTAPATNAQLDPETLAEQKRIQPLIDLIRSQNPYRLSRDGALTLPGFAPIPLLGLSNDQATLRLSVEPALRGIVIHVTQLPLRRTGVEGLKPFGYELFTRKGPSTFAPVTNVPVPSDYIVGAGDQLGLQLYGTQNRSLKLVVDRDGRINIPEIGPVNVAGQRFTSVKAALEGRVERQLIGVHASVSMGDTRSIRSSRDGRGQAPRLVHYQRSGHRDLGVVRRWRGQGGWVAAQHRAQAPRPARASPRPLRSSDSRRHHG